MFIELTDEANGTKLLFNTRHILSISPNNKGKSRIRLDNYAFTCNELYKDVIPLLTNITINTGIK